MGRKSKLSPAQWTEIGRRLLEGESASELGRAFGITESTIRGHFERNGQKTTEVREVANMVAAAKEATDTAQRALHALPPQAQVAANSLAAKLISISESMACGAELGARNYHRLNAIANQELQRVDDADLASETSVAALKNVTVLTKIANECNVGPSNLLAANRDQMKRINEDEPAEPTQELTPERMTEAARRIAFVLARAGAMETN